MSKVDQFRQTHLLVDAEVRQQLKAYILANEVKSYDDLVGLNQYLIALVVAGELSPEGAKAAEAFVKYILAALTAKQLTGPKVSTRERNQTLDALQKAEKRIENRTPVFDHPSLVETRERSKVPTS